MKPSLPQTISRDVQCIKASTWNRLLECLAWAMDHPKGDGRSIRNDGAGNLSAVAGRRGGHAAEEEEEAKGAFWTEVDDDGKKLRIMNGDNEEDPVAGVIRCGTRNFSVKTQTFGLKEGVLYVYVRYNDKKYTSGATFASKLPEQPGKRTWTARIATVTKDDGEFTLTRIHHGSDLDVLGRWTE